MRYDAYLRRLISRIFKLLPMREQVDEGVNLFLDTYVSDLADETVGACVTFPELYEMPDFVSVVNSLNYMRGHWADMEFANYRSTVLKMTNNISDIVEGVR